MSLKFWHSRSSRIGRIAASGLFDRHWYGRQVDDEFDSLDGAIAHYLSHGEAVSPHPLFDIRWYASRSGRAVANLTAYLQRGRKAEISPCPAFSTAYYRSQISEPLPRHITPLEHYLTQGWTAGLKPHALFDPREYLAQNPDVAAAGVEPLTHYAAFGYREGRSASSLVHIPFIEQQCARDWDLDNPFFVALGPGPTEGIDPHPLFDSAWYASRVHRAGPD